jgi:hypothetical protein
MLARVCYVVIAHNEPANLLGLIGSLWNPGDAFLIWLDAKADQHFVELARAATRFGTNVQVNIGSVMVWGGFSIVDTTLTAYARLRTQVGRFSHVILCSGSHIPLLHPEAIFAKIENMAGWIDTVEVKIPAGGLGALDQGGPPQSWWQHILRRIRYRYVEVPGVGTFAGSDREAWHAPALLEGSQWHVLRSDLLDFIVANEQRVRDLFHDVVVADEHAFQWIAAQSPMAAEIRQGKSVHMEWAGASPRRVSFSQAATQAAAGQHLFVRKAAVDCTIDLWSDWAARVLSNPDGADKLREVAAGLDWTGGTLQRSAPKPTTLQDAVLPLLAAAVSASSSGKVEPKRLGAQRFALATARYFGLRGPVWLICALEPGSGIAVIPAVRRTPALAANDPLWLRPPIPDLPDDFVNLPIDGRVYWMITEAAANDDIQAFIKDVFEQHTQEWSRPMTDRQVSNRTWINQIVKGRSFADVGGLWGTVNERVSVAMLAGASAASMLDITPAGHSLWRDFDARCKSLDVSGYRNICVDIMGADLKQKAGTFDVVHCSGVIYHVPDLIGFIRNLMSITTRHLIIQSMVVAERIENEHGVLDLSGGHCMFVPLLNDTQRKIVTKYLDQVGLLNIPDLTGPPVKSWFHHGVWNYAPWSWLITPAFLRRLVEICGLSVLDAGFVWENKAYSVFCEIPPAQ